MKTTNRWRIAIAGVFLQIALGAVYPWRVFGVPLSKQFGWGISEVTLTFTISIFVLGLAAFFGGLWGLSGARCRIRAEELALHPEHGRHRFGIHGDVQERPLSGVFILGVAGSHPSELVMAHLNIDMAAFDAIPKNGISVTPLS